jgi:glycosyltransferase involved in cell wall biosynthesis
MSRRRTVIYLTNYVGPELARQRGITSYSDAANRRVEELVRVLRQAEYAVRLISAGWKRSDQTFRRYPPADESLPDGTVCHYLGYLDCAVLNLFFCLWDTFWCLGKLRRRHPDCVVLFYNPSVQSGLPALLARWFFRVPIFIELEDGTHLIKSVGLFRNLSFRLLLTVSRRFISGAIVPSAPLAGFYDRLPVYVFRGCPLSDTIVPQRGAAPDGSLTFLFGGTLDEIRGVDLLVSALEILERNSTFEGTGVSFVITGSGPWQNRLPARLETFHKVDATYLGRLDTAEYRRVLSRSHVGLALQKRDHPFSKACFPSKVISFIAAGKLVITTAIADLEEFIGDKALILHDDDPRRLADLIMNVCREPARYLALGERARTWFTTEHSLPKTALELRRLIG